MDRDQWYDCIIAQDDDSDYSESGWVAFHYEGVYYLAHYSHCSCYDTLEALNFDPVNNVRWRGTWDQLLALASAKGDPDMPERQADPEDYDYDHLMSVYEQLITQM